MYHERIVESIEKTYEPDKNYVMITSDTAADIPDPAEHPEWEVGSELVVLENGGSKYQLSNAREWVSVNFMGGENVVPSGFKKLPVGNYKATQPYTIGWENIVNGGENDALYKTSHTVEFFITDCGEIVTHFIQKNVSSNPGVNAVSSTYTYLDGTTLPADLTCMGQGQGISYGISVYLSDFYAKGVTTIEDKNGNDVNIYDTAAIAKIMGLLKRYDVYAKITEIDETKI